jgi:hypothetical protein
MQTRPDVTLHRARSLRRAAEFLHLKQSTLSRSVRALEEELKVVLFERSGAGVMPAAAGAPFITSARRVICEVNTMTGIARDAGRGAAFELRLYNRWRALREGAVGSKNLDKIGTSWLACRTADTTKWSHRQLPRHSGSGRPINSHHHPKDRPHLS